MRDAGMYTQLWKKYLPVIRLLLKKTTDGDQKLQLYKHEFESTGARNKLGYIFSLEMVNGKPINKSNKTAVSNDLCILISENEAIATWMKEQHIKISVNRACEMSFVLVAKQAVEEVAEEVAAEA
ncbi:MAG: hypothetical protein V4651_14590 [Bacteroidota bacterium]